MSSASSTSGGASYADRPAASRDRVGAIQEALHPVEHVEILAVAGLIHEVVQFRLLCIGQSIPVALDLRHDAIEPG